MSAMASQICYFFMSLFRQQEIEFYIFRPFSEHRVLTAASVTLHWFQRSCNHWLHSPAASRHTHRRRFYAGRGDYVLLKSPIPSRGFTFRSPMMDGLCHQSAVISLDYGCCPCCQTEWLVKLMNMLYALEASSIASPPNVHRKRWSEKAILFHLWFVYQQHNWPFDIKIIGNRRNQFNGI